MFPSFSLPFGWLEPVKGNFFLAFPSFSLPFSSQVTCQSHNETLTLRSFGAHRRDSRHIFCKIFQVFRASTTPENFAECVSRCLHAKMSFCKCHMGICKRTNLLNHISSWYHLFSLKTHAFRLSKIQKQLL